jgi:hypothetical protein
MKISLTDVASFATGVLNANEANTKARIKLREKQLQADRDFNIAQKQDKYAAELALYKKEKEKATEITRLNEEVKNNKLGQEAYAAQYLMTTLGADKYKLLQSQPNVLQKMINDIQETKDYKFSLNRDLIDKQAQVDVSTINKVFSDEMKNPKGEDVLVNKIRGLLGMKQDATETVQDNLNKQLEAAKIVEKVVDQRSELSGIKLSTSKKSSTPYIDKSKEEYKSFANEVSTKLTDLSKLNLNKSSPNNGDALKQSFNILNIPNVGDYYRTNPEGKITEFRKGGEKFANTTSSQWKHYKDYLNIQGTDNLFLKHNGDRSKLVAEFDKENLNGEIAIRTSKFAVPIVDGNILGKGGSLDFTTVFRNKNNLIVVPTANTIDFDDTFKGTNAKVIPEIAKVAYANAMKKNAMVNNQFNSQKLSQNQLLLESLRYGKTSPLLEKVNEDFKNEYNKLYKSIELKNKNNLPEETNKKSTGLIPLIEITNPQTGTKRTFADTPDNRKKAEAAGATFVVIKSTQAESKSNTSNEFDDFGDAPFIPQRTRGEMSMEERRLFEKEKREKQKDIVSKRREEFNKKIRELNQSRNKPSQ